MGYEVDFLEVGEGERGGNAIALRWGNLNGDRSEQKVMIIDGGTKESGKALIERINQYYGTNDVDYVFCSHPDADHSSGLTEVLENMNVGVLCLHRPWERAQELKGLFKNGKITSSGLESNFKKALENAYELEQIALKKGVKILELFSDDFNNNTDQIIVLSPSQEYYDLLLANFRETPEASKENTLIEKIAIGIKEVITWIAEHWHLETLEDPDENETSAENNSSIILLLQIDGQQLLFTGDAGAEALIEAVKKAASLDIDLKGAHFIQIPHHGSKHNVGPTILDVLLGPKLEEGSVLDKIAFVSAPQEGDPKHPSRKVVNAFQRRGVKVIATQGSGKRHHKDAPPREGWVAAKPLPFYDKVAD